MVKKAQSTQDKKKAGLVKYPPASDKEWKRALKRHRWFPFTSTEQDRDTLSEFKLHPADPVHKRIKNFKKNASRPRSRTTYPCQFDADDLK